MKIFVLDRGSSSIKCCVYDFDRLPSEVIPPIWEAHLQWKNNFESSALTINGAQSGKSFTSAREALTYLAHLQTGIEVIGHRIVHGGKKYRTSVIIDAAVKREIQKLSELAPLHNLADLEGIDIFEELFPSIPQVAVFDTAFHHTMPQAAVVYPGPYAWYEAEIQRYGFHGISFQYCTQRLEKLLKTNTAHLKCILCHLGSGASLCAVQGGKSIDTTMGFTPLEGLMMDTRSGTVDPGILLHLLKEKTPDILSKQLNEESGLLGISGFSSDMRDVMIHASQGDARARLALDVYVHRLNGLIGSMLASLQGLNVLVFTAGIGENAPEVRKRVCDAFGFLGLKLDEEKNRKAHKEDVILSTKDSAVQVVMIHTQEMFAIARECMRIKKAGDVPQA